ncbi:Eukaryotic translation initiation factor 5B [Heracleum sosnowskyi]|uniref:Eukaryotic translation initiation factor 5B n=1 Tax=Heracleum sosnowskyi TaxID=360622 RepID=A0AAD8IW58_9APIA|nr:Eukaryotic translation initiation factor 5B [Heracleum sosnowskyi]
MGRNKPVSQGATELLEDHVAEVMQVAPAKDKGKKNKKSKNYRLKDSDEGDDDSVVQGDGDDVITKKLNRTKNGNNARFSVSTFELLGDDGESSGVEDQDGDGASSEADTAVAFMVNDDFSSFDGDASTVIFSGKKKSSKKKSNIGFLQLEVEESDKVVGEQEKPNASVSGRGVDHKKSEDTSDDVVVTSVGKKKKKKSVRTAQEEEDLTKILAELGVGPPPVKTDTAPQQEEKVPAQNEPDVAADTAFDKEVGEGIVESAAKKKNKKKKEKEKEKKAAAAAAAPPSVDEKQEEIKNKVADKKKVPRHVREMQERIAKQKAEAERMEREEEERLKKEEEERIRLEELERQAEEKKRLKKEKDKEKLLKKKQEGKLLTGKHKEETRRREAMRKQFLASADDVPLTTADIAGALKRPKYQKMKPKPNSQVNGRTLFNSNETKEADKKQEVMPCSASFETEKVEQTNSMEVEEKPDVADVVKEDGMEEDDEEEWDAKSWEDDNLKLLGKSTFADEEADLEPNTGVKNNTKSSRTHSCNTKPSKPTEKAFSTALLESQDNDKSLPKGDVASKTKKKNLAQKKELQKADGENLRSPICCIMGHVDTGKTKLLDCIRGTNVQEGEAGGITQQIGATYFPAENLRDRSRELKADVKLKVPGLLVIDTPGHESFTNLRSRGSGLCDIAILVVDIMHGLEPQTIESLNLLRMRNTEFIVALNKVDRLYGWNTCRNAPITKAMKQQSQDVQNEFKRRLIQVTTQFKEQGLNTEVYYDNKEIGKTINIVPTSAVSGEGIPDLLLLLAQWSPKTMVEKLTYSNVVQCTVLEVKGLEGYGTTIDVVLVNGVLHVGDQIVVCGMQGPIVTTIRVLLTPHPMKELRVKGACLHHKEIKGAQSIKIAAQSLEHAIAGTGLYVVGPNDDLEVVKESAMEDMNSVMSRTDKSGEGVYVQASTLGSLEALLEFLKTPAVNIPVSGIGIGPVHKKDVVWASAMLNKKKEYATILAFDVNVKAEARELADEKGVKIFIADIIYHLFDQFKAYIGTLKEEKKKEAADEAVFPCVLKIMPNCVFNKKDPIILGVDVLEGIAKVGTPICIPQKEFIDIGQIASIENNHKPVNFAKKGSTVAIKIIGSNPDEQQKMFVRHFEIEDELVSHLSRRSIDKLKENYRDKLSNEEWRLVVKLKNLFKIL